MLYNKTSFTQQLTAKNDRMLRRHIGPRCTLPTWGCVYFVRGRAVAESIGGGHRDVVDLAAADPRHAAGALVGCLAGRQLPVAALHRRHVGVGPRALRPGHHQRVGFALHHGAHVLRGARHWSGSGMLAVNDNLKGILLFLSHILINQQITQTYKLLLFSHLHLTNAQFMNIKTLKHKVMSADLWLVI